MVQSACMDHGGSTIAATGVCAPASRPLDKTGRTIVVSAHAVIRFSERVDPSASVREAFGAVDEIACRGRVCPRPRHWMCDVRCEPGTVFVYWQEWPGVALVVRDDCVLTVLTRDLTRGAAERRRSRNRTRDCWPRRRRNEV
jgi:hypothetical protein